MQKGIAPHRRGAQRRLIITEFAYLITGNKTATKERSRNQELQAETAVFQSRKAASSIAVSTVGTVHKSMFLQCKYNVFNIVSHYMHDVNYIFIQWVQKRKLFAFGNCQYSFPAHTCQRHITLVP